MLVLCKSVDFFMRFFTVFDPAVNYFPPDTRRGTVTPERMWIRKCIVAQGKKNTSSIPPTSYGGGDGGCP